MIINLWLFIKEGIKIINVTLEIMALSQLQSTKWLCWQTNPIHTWFEQWHDYLGRYKELLSEHLVIRHGSAITYKHEYYHLIHKLICWLEVKDETLNSYQNINLPMLSIFIYSILYSYGGKLCQKASFEKLGLK